MSIVNDTSFSFNKQFKSHTSQPETAINPLQLKGNNNKKGVNRSGMLKW